MADRFHLKSVEFRNERQATWRELEQLIARVQSRGITSLAAADLERLPNLYRATVSALSVARAISLDRNVLEYLENLTQRAYFAVYGTKRHLLDELVEFFTRTFPRAVRGMGRELALATLVFGVGVLVGFVLTAQDEDYFYSFVDPNLAGGRGPHSTRDELSQVLFSGENQSSGELGYFAAFLFRNNAGIGILAFALGILGGVPTLFLMLVTGLMMGGFAGLHHNRDLNLELWSWLLPHGITEILAVLLCGAAGLVLARAVVFPDRRSRFESLAVLGRSAGGVVVGSVILFFIAGLIEGIFRQRVQSIPVRYVVAALTGLLWLGYFVLGGRGGRT